MSLMQLLAVGHSIVGIKDAPSRYKLQEHWLPRFGPLASTSAVPAPAPAIAPASARARISFGAGYWFRASDAEPVRAAEPAAKPSAPVSVQTFAGAVSGSAEPRVAVVRPAAVLRAAKPARPPLTHPELSLDRVRVMRNDLSDADLEIVPATTDVRPTGAPADRLPPTPAPAASSGWGQLAERLFQAGRGLF
jgi:hypothetical protein